MGRVLIGLTGTYGSGKSTVADMLTRHGVAIVDTDVIARQVVEPPSDALAAIKEEFGEEYLLADGRLDRARMAQTVFASREDRERLDAIVHPPVLREMWRQVDELAEGPAEAPAAVVLVIPLLFETELAESVDKVVVVTTSEAQRFARVRRRDGLSESEIVERLAAQLPQRDKAARADRVIDNSGSLEATRLQVQQLAAEWLR